MNDVLHADFEQKRAFSLKGVFETSLKIVTRDLFFSKYKKQDIRRQSFRYVAFHRVLEKLVASRTTRRTNISEFMSH